MGRMALPGAARMRSFSLGTFVGLIAIGLLGLGGVALYQYTAKNQARLAYERCVDAASHASKSSFDLTNAMNTCRFLHDHKFTAGKYGSQPGPAIRVAMQDRPVL
jgi:predicted negative regulator of RcsB-dependent stress response